METVQKNFGEISENTLLILLFLIGTVISILDCLTTYIILQLGGIEFNPIITPILGNCKKFFTSGPACKERFTEIIFFLYV